MFVSVKDFSLDKFLNDLLWILVMGFRDRFKFIRRFMLENVFGGIALSLFLDSFRFWILDCIGKLFC